MAEPTKKKNKQKMNPTAIDKPGDNKKTSSVKTKNSFREFIEAIVVAFIAAIILRIFLVQAFRIPTGSMKDTLMIGDFLLVNKFIYGVRTPDRIPLVDIPIPFLRLPALKNPERGNIIVFKYPLDESLDYIKRCVGQPGQTLEVKNGVVYIDGQIEGSLTKTQSRIYDEESYRHFDYFEVKTEWGDVYTIRQLSNMTVPMDNYGPVRIPKKGDVIRFPLKNESEWAAYENLIRHEKHSFSRQRGSDKIFIDNVPVDNYVVTDNYYFMMGDNRDNSSDSRDWGFLPYENIVGEALVIYFSWDSVPSLFNIFQKIRWERIGQIIR